jgi:hypothetical protein
LWLKGPDFGSRSGHCYSSPFGACEVCVTGKEAAISNSEVDRCARTALYAVGSGEESSVGHVSGMFCGVEEALAMFGIVLELDREGSKSSNRHVQFFSS